MTDTDPLDDLDRVAQRLRRARDETRSFVDHLRKDRDGLKRELAAADHHREAKADRIAELEAEVERLRAAQQQEEDAHGVTVDQRDRAQEMADKLAAALADGRWIGEHSSMNDPWQNALDMPARAAQPALPDVGPVTRDPYNRDIVEVTIPGQGGLRWYASALDTRERDALLHLAAVRAARAFLDGEAVDEPCMSRGPRIGSDGVPRCKLPKGHEGRHAPAVEDGWDATVVWSDRA